jgi:Flp pilus assembly protein TadB
VAGLGKDASAVQAAAQRAGITVPDAVRASYERAASDEQYAALARTLPQAAAAITAVGAAQRAAAVDRDPLSAVGAAALGVQGRADEASALLDLGEYGRATSVAAEVASRSDRALLVGLALPVLLLVLLAGAVIWWRRRRAARARRRTEQHASFAALAPADPPLPASGDPVPASDDRR